RRQLNAPTIQVDAPNRGLGEPGGAQESSEGEGAMAEVEGPGENLKQQRRHDEEVVPADQDDLDVRPAPAKLFQVTGGVDAAEAAPEDDDAGLRGVGCSSDHGSPRGSAWFGRPLAVTPGFALPRCRGAHARSGTGGDTRRGLATIQLLRLRGARLKR